MDPSSLVTGTGHACVRTADSNSWQRVNMAPPADAPPRPLPPPSGQAVTVHGLSTPTVHAPSTALSTADGQSSEQDEMGGWVERLSGDDENDDTRRVKILAVLGEVGRPLGLSAIEARTGVPRSTARRLVEAFVEDGLVVAEQGASNGLA